jgi:hypothetical protein
MRTAEALGESPQPHKIYPSFSKRKETIMAKKKKEMKKKEKKKKEKKKKEKKKCKCKKNKKKK